MTGKKQKTDLVIITKEEYAAIAAAIAKAHLINLRYQARCTCKIDMEDFL